MFKLSVVIGVMAAVAWAQDEAPDKRLSRAESVLQSVNSEKGIPHDLLSRSKCVMIVPGLKKGAFIVGGDYGRGFAICRSGDSWGAPAAIRLSGGSFGAQLGVESTDLVMLVMNQRGMDRLTRDKFTIGADASAAIGPVGRDVSAGTDATLRAELLTYARSKGAFAGVSLDGTVVTADRSEDRKLYGRDVTNAELIRGQIRPTDAANALIADLNNLAAGQSTPQLAQVNPPAPVQAQAPTYSQPQTQVQPAPSTPQQTASNTAPQDNDNNALPQTASPYPMIGLAGLVLIGMYAGLRVSSRL